MASSPRSLAQVRPIIAETTEGFAAGTPFAPPYRRFGLVKELGKGSIGVVYKASIQQLGRLITLGAV